MSDRATLKLSKQDVTRKALERIDVVAFSFSLFEVKKSTLDHLDGRGMSHSPTLSMASCTARR